MPRVIAHTAHLLDHLRHPRQCPQIRREAVDQGSLPQSTVQLSELLSTQPGLTSSSTGLAQSPRSLPKPGAVPAVDARARCPQPASDFGMLEPSGGEHPRGLFAAGFKAVKVPSRTESFLHAESVTGQSTISGQSRYSILRDSNRCATEAHVTGEPPRSAGASDRASTLTPSMASSPRAPVMSKKTCPLASEPSRFTSPRTPRSGLHCVEAGPWFCRSRPSCNA
jgi:hypothetical protein